MLVSQVLFLWVAATWATPLSFTEADSEAMSDQALAEAYLRQQQGATTTPYAAAQQLYFEQRRTEKRGPPTPGFSSTGLTTPLGSEPTAPAPEEASGSQATPPAQGFVQAFQVQDDVALQLTAAQAGVNPQDTGALRTWLGGTVTTRATVLETIRHYHKAVIRPELYASGTGAYSGGRSCTPPTRPIWTGCAQRTGRRKSRLLVCKFCFLVFLRTLLRKSAST